VAVKAMSAHYRTDNEAMEGVRESIDEFYRRTYPVVYSSRRKVIDNAIRATQRAYLRNIFPAMKTRWSDYPNNVGHLIFPGCMRCHDGKHAVNRGTIIPRDCHACHIILEQGKTGPEETLNLNQGLDFQHPVDIGSVWKKTGCYECHSGVQP
jgi:hypothetical protein